MWLGALDQLVERRHSVCLGEAPEVRIDTTIKFQDGKVSHIRTTLLVRRLQLGRAA